MALQGNIDHVDRESVQGWVRDEAVPDEPVSLMITVEGQFSLRVLANAYRMDLERAGIGRGRHGFSARFDGLSPLQPHLVQVVREESGEPLPGAPIVLRARPRFDGEVQDYLAAMLADTESDNDLLVRAGFLAQQADRLLQLRADRAAAPGLRHFRARWSGRAGDEIAPAPRALVIDDRMPALDRDAGSTALVSHMRSLRRLGFSVMFLPADTQGGAAAAALAGDGIMACHAPWTASVEEVLRREAGGFALVYLHRASNTRYLPLIRHYQPRARLVYCVADLHHLRLARQAKVEERPELTELSHRVRNAELAAATFADAVITHSSFEAEILRRDAPKARVYMVPWSILPRPVATPWSERRGVAFVGSYGHAPNLDAAWWLLQDVLPLVRAQIPDLECSIIGSEMPDSLRAAERPGVRILGQVSDLASVLGQMRLTVAPLAFGAGVKGKLLDSLAFGLPCACTTIAAEGLDLPPALQATVADTPATLAQMIVRLHEDAAFNAVCAEAGLAFIAADWCETRLDALMRTVVQSALG